MSLRRPVGADVAKGSGQFELWWDQREEALAVTSEDNPSYEPLMDVLARLEELIFETPSLVAAAVRIKGRLLLWLMEQERHDGRVAMRHLLAYLETLPDRPLARPART